MEDRVAGRIGDVVVVMTQSGAVVNSARMRPETLRLLGQHGALTEDERLIPLFSTLL